MLNARLFFVFFLTSPHALALDSLKENELANFKIENSEQFTDTTSPLPEQQPKKPEIPNDPTTEAMKAFKRSYACIDSLCFRTGR